MTQSLSVLQRATKADVRTDPFPHLVIDRALPEDLYQQLVAINPRPKALGVDETKNNKRWTHSALRMKLNFFLPRLWKQFIAYHSSDAFFREIVDLFYEQIHALYPDRFPSYETLTRMRVGSRGIRPFSNNDVLMEALMAGNTPVRQASSVRTTHVDTGEKLFSGLFYMRNDDDDSVGGDLTISRFKPHYSFEDKLGCFNYQYVDEKHVEHIQTVKYSRNVLVLLLNSLDALHGVTVRQPTQHSRRFVNLVVAVDPPLYYLSRTGERPITTQARSPIAHAGRAPEVPVNLFAN